MVNQKIISLGIPGVSQPQRTLVLVARGDRAHVDFLLKAFGSLISLASRLTKRQANSKPRKYPPKGTLPTNMNQPITFDATDHAIVEQLRTNGRANNQQIAETLGLTATTVSTRIKRMEDANQLRVVGVSDFSAHGYNVLVKIAIEIDGRPASHVAQELAELPEIFAVHLVTGRYDIDVLVALHDFDDLNQFLFDNMAKVQGIRSLTPAVVVDVIKYQFDVAPIEGRE